MIEAKLKGEGIEDEAAPEPAATNVIDLMAALKRSLGDDAAAAKAEAKPAAKAAARAKPEKPAAAPHRTSRKRAS